MFKKLQNKDEIEESHKPKGASLNKVEVKIKKEILENKKPIHPKFIFNNLKKKVVNKKYRKPKPKDEDKPLINITIEDY